MLGRIKIADGAPVSSEVKRQEAFIPKQGVKPIGTELHAGDIPRVLGNSKPGDSDKTFTPRAVTPGQTLGQTQPQQFTAKPRGMDPSTPNTYVYNSDAELPADVMPITKNRQGNTLGMASNTYDPDLNYFSSFKKDPNTRVKPRNAALADRAVSNALGLAYSGSDIFQPLATTSSGRQVYSTVGAVNNGDTTLGSKNIESLNSSMLSLGVRDDSFQIGIKELNDLVNSPEKIKNLDQYANPKDVTNQLLKDFLGEGYELGDDDADEQIASGAARLGEVWGNLSPGQKHLGLASLAKPVIQKKHGFDVSNATVPGTDNAIGGALSVKAPLGMMANGTNGFAVARNWNQLKAISKIVGVDTEDTGELGWAMSNAGFVGYGPQDGAVELNPADMQRLNSTAAPEFGLGALKLHRGMTLPKGYREVTVTPDNMSVIMPEDHIATSPFANTKSAPLAYKNTMQVAEGKHPAQRFWGASPTRGIAKGSAGGSGLFRGISNLMTVSPNKFAAIAAYSLFNESHGDDDEVTDIDPTLKR